MIESSIVTLDGKIIDYAKGTAASVEFDFERIWFAIKNSHSSSKWLQFIHVHPQGILKASATDINCIQGFNAAFGTDYTYLFSIIVFANSDMFDITYTGTVYLCNYHVEGYKEVAKDIPISNDQLLFLKHLSYTKEIENANI